MTNTNATYATSIAVDLPDYPAATVTFTNTAFFVSGNSEVLPGKQYTLILNSSGQGTQTLPCPDNTGDLAINWRINLPSKESGTYAIGYDAATQQLAAILAAQSTTTDPDVITAAIAAKANKVAGGVEDNFFSIDVNGDLQDSGFAASDFDAAGSAATAQAAAIADVERAAISSRLNGEVSFGTTFTLRNPINPSRTGIYILSAYSSAAEAVRVISISGTEMTTLSAIENSHADDALVLYLQNETVTPQMFGATGDGTTDDTAALQSALDVALVYDATKVSGGYYRGTTVFLPAGTYRVTSSLDMTDRRDVRLCGTGTEQSIIYSEATGKAVIDLVGSGFNTFSHFSITGGQTNRPKVGLFLARSTAANGQIASYNKFEQVTIDGYYQSGCVALYSAELNTFENCFVHPTGDTGLEFGIYSAAYNDYSITSDYATISNTASNSTNWVKHCAIQLAGSVSSFVPVRLGRLANGFTVRDSFLHTTGNYNVLVTGNSYRLRLENLTCEGAVDDIVHFAPYSGAAIVYNMCINSVGNSAYTRAAVYAEDGVDVYEANIQNIRGGNNISAMRFDEVYRSVILNWVTTPGTGGFICNKIYHSEVYIPSSGLTVNTQELYNIFYKRGGSGTSGNQTVLSGGFVLGSAATVARAGLSTILEGSKEYNPGSVANGASVNTTITVTGSAVGDYALISTSNGVNVMATGFCGANTVYVTFLNRSGATWSPGTITISALVVKTD